MLLLVLLLLKLLVLLLLSFKCLHSAAGLAGVLDFMATGEIVDWLPVLIPRDVTGLVGALVSMATGEMSDWLTATGFTPRDIFELSPLDLKYSNTLNVNNYFKLFLKCF